MSLLYYITDRHGLHGDALPTIRAAIAAGVDWIQIREKDLATQELWNLVRQAVELSQGRPTRILVNSRVDVALGAGAAGVHLPADAMPAAAVRRIAPQGFLIGVSCHSAPEVLRAQDEGTDFAVFGPVFETASKKAYGSPKGLASLEQACKETEIPVLALGGITLENAGSCLRAGAAGVAAISLFQEDPSIGATVRMLRDISP